MSLLNVVTSISHKMEPFNIKKTSAMTYSAAQSLETNFSFNPRAQMHCFRVSRIQCSLLTIFFFWQRKAWHSRVSLNWLWETYAKTLSWVLSAVQYEILKRKMQEYIYFFALIMPCYTQNSTYFLIKGTFMPNKEKQEECISCRPALLTKNHTSKYL